MADVRASPIGHTRNLERDAAILHGGSLLVGRIVTTMAEGLCVAVGPHLVVPANLGLWCGYLPCRLPWQAAHKVIRFVIESSPSLLLNFR